jgi:hypothetical protein
VDGHGIFSLHGRGKWKCELIFKDEDLARKIKKWMITRVRKEELNVDAALEFFDVLLFGPFS